MMSFWFTEGQLYLDDSEDFAVAGNTRLLFH